MQTNVSDLLLYASVFYTLTAFSIVIFYIVQCLRDRYLIDRMTFSITIQEPSSNVGLDQWRRCLWLLIVSRDIKCRSACVISLECVNN